MPLTETIERLTSFSPRLPGTEGDRQTTDFLAKQLGQLGRKVEIDELRVRPDHHFAHAAHALLAVIGTVVAVKVPPLGLVIVLFAAASMYLDLTARAYLVRSLLPRKRTRNVTSPGTLGGARTRLLITAHHDAGRTGLYGRWSGLLPGALGRVAGALDLVFWSIAVAMLLSALRVLTGASDLLTAVQFLLVVVLLVELLLLVDAAFSEPSPGASNNASGVAAALELASRLEGDPTSNIDVWIVFTGAKESLMLGMRDWLRKRRSQLARQRNIFVNIDMLGDGEVRYLRAEGFVAAYEHSRHLVEVCEQLADQHTPAAPAIWRAGTDGVIPAMQNQESITVCCLRENGQASNLYSMQDTADAIDSGTVRRATDFIEHLVRRLDEEA